MKSKEKCEDNANILMARRHELGAKEQKPGAKDRELFIVGTGLRLIRGTKITKKKRTSKRKKNISTYQEQVSIPLAIIIAWNYVYFKYFITQISVLKNTDLNILIFIFLKKRNNLCYIFYLTNFIYF